MTIELTDEEAAALARYLRQSWMTNDFRSPRGAIRLKRYSPSWNRWRRNPNHCRL
jgi:hypothetical protein